MQGSRRGEPGLHRLGVLWDARLYQLIAERGYSGVAPIPGPHGLYEMYAFFPAYPALTNLVWRLTPLSINASALLVAWAASLVAAWGVFAVVARLYRHRAGVIAAVLWGITPVAVVESMAYSEPLFAAFAFWAVYAVLARRWIWAGGLTVLAGLTRPTGSAVAMTVAVSAAWEVVHRFRGRSERSSPGAGPAWWRPVLGGLLAPLGFVGYIAWVGVQKGRWDAYFKIQEAWDSRFDFGRNTYQSFSALLSSSGTVWLADVVVAIVLIGSVLLLGVSVIQRQPLPLVLFSLGILVLALGDAAYFNCRARFLLPAFGLLLPIAMSLTRLRSRASLVLVLSGAALTSAVYGGYLAFVYPNAP
ncbi:hypothetical protein [Kitasatospora nipponensis]|uniref:hypothetical protein n=1 Tax=Kitasatospora nipponensis TaxID=258049 RepID=UPI0031E04889